jgi:hypothetical protein
VPRQALGEDLPSVGAPLSLGRTVRTAWSLYRRRAAPLAVLFIVTFAAIMALQTALLSASGSARGPDAADVLAAILLRVVVPIVVGSYATALAAVMMRDAMLTSPSGISAAAAKLRPVGRELLASALVAAMLGLFFVVPPFNLVAPLLGMTFFGLVYGPPVLVHVIALERRPLKLAWPRARSLLKGNWARLILYLTAVTFLITLVASLLVQPAVRVPLVVLEFAYMLILGLLMPLLVAVSFVGYLDVREQRDGREVSEPT